MLVFLWLKVYQERFYMVKKGFTLAEVLITLSIIGVVAAITLPTLMSNTTDAQIGPKLAKAVSMFQQANTALLNENSVDTLTDTGLLDSSGTAASSEEGETGASSSSSLSAYINALSNHMKVSAFTYPAGTAQSATGDDTTTCATGASFAAGTPVIANDGILYVINKDVTPDATKPAHKQRIGNVYVDINAAAKPNAIGTDIFVFSWWNDGSLRPVGSSNWAEGTACTWQDACPNDAVATDYKACTGAIFENNLKVLYK